ncbi:MAG: hypothetical protein ACQEQ7_01805, partial [Thermodesulfobacteriota bacterium]
SKLPSLAFFVRGFLTPHTRTLKMLSERIPRCLSESSVDPDLSGLQGSSNTGAKFDCGQGPASGSVLQHLAGIVTVLLK